MPQLDPSSFASQLFWLVLSFALLYFILQRFVLPQIGDVLESRRNKITHDVAQAEQFQRDAEKARVQYESALTQSRKEANDLLVTATQAIEREALQRHQKLDATLMRQMDEAETRIENARRKATETLVPVAADLVGAMVKKLVRVEIAPQQVKQVVAEYAKDIR